ncbi:MAG: hypothetical protein HRF43_01155 [Phycisphaerae bacterium]|jgi:hypothetical protein
MPTNVTAGDGDTLCKIAVERGFRNCKKLRDANPELANRELRPGDVVTVPDVTPKEESGQTEQLHKFIRRGVPVRRVFIIKDFNRPAPIQALRDTQPNLAVNNYVPNRQGTGFATSAWFAGFGHDAGASADPDHFKIQVFDKEAQQRGDTVVRLTLQVQRPRLDANERITAWEDLTDPGTSLVDLECQQVGGPDSPWYRSKYLRLFAERDDQNNRATDNVDTGVDLSGRSLVAHLPADDRRLQVLDLRVRAHKEVDGCGATGTQPKCRALALAGVGKDEKALKIKVLRVHGTGNQAALTTLDQIHDVLLRNMKLQIAQCDLGLQLIEIKDVPPPRNMISVSDHEVVKATGGQRIGATVALSTGNVTATITTGRKDKPQETAQKLAIALRALGVTCRVSPNPAKVSSGDDFGPCDILCFNADGSPARVLGVSNSANERQKLRHTGLWNNNSVTTGDSQYGAAEGDFRFIGSADFRALLKNNFVGTGTFHAYVINNFSQPNPNSTLLGYALIPYHEVTPRIRPIAAFTMGVLVSNNAALRKTVLTHEAGHVLLDAIHTTKALSPGPDQDLQGNTDNRRLAFSEIMTAFDSSQPGGTPQPFLHKRLSDDPLTVEFLIVHGNLDVKQELFGSPPHKSTVRRFRELFASVYAPLRALRPAAGANL